MPRKAIIGVIAILVVALVTYSAAGIIGGAIVGRAAWPAWRESHVFVFFLAWIGSVVVISLPVLWFAGRRLEKSLSSHEQSVAAARGVGRFAMRALQGDVAATDKLFDLLEDPSAAVRSQSARALAILDKREVDKELSRQVRYWQANDKLALINTLKTAHDFRTRRLMQMLADDRNPAVARRAQTSMYAVTPRTSRMDNVAASVKESRKAPGEAVGLGEQSVGQRRTAAAKPSAGDQSGAARRAGAGSAVRGAAEGMAAAAGAAKKRAHRTLPSMAPGERAARAAARQEVARSKRAVRDAISADDRPPLRKKAADVAPRPASSAAPRKRPGAAATAATPSATAPKPAVRPGARRPKPAVRQAESGSTPVGTPNTAPAADAPNLSPPADAPAAGASTEES